MIKTDSDTELVYYPYGSFIRKAPKQQRSRDRLELIVDTTAQLLTEAGAKDLTMARLAEASGLTPGSVYEYVNDVADAIAAVGLRGLARLGNRVISRFSEPTTALEASQIVVDLVDVIIEVFDTEVGFREALATMNADPALANINIDDSRANARVAADSFKQFTDPAIHDELYGRSLIATHLSGEVANLMMLLPENEAQQLLKAFRKTILEMFGLPPLP